MLRLNLSAKELLALHDLLHERFDGMKDCYPDDGDLPDRAYKVTGKPSAEASAQALLRQVHGRLRALIIGALTGREAERVLAHEQAKIDDLELAMQEARAAHNSLPEELRGKQPVDLEFLKLDPDEADDLSPPPYPRRGAVGPRGPRSNGRNKR